MAQDIWAYLLIRELYILKKNELSCSLMKTVVKVHGDLKQNSPVLLKLLFIEHLKQ